jgi:YegS/Rv2252/BmrU family lipid kinase
MKVFVVVNPVSGRNEPQEVRKILNRYFKAPEWQLEIYETTGEDSVADVVRQAIDKGAEWVFAVGGDGTISAVADGLVGTEVSLGIIPAGTGNVLAQELNIPSDFDKACRILAEKPDIRKLDALQVNNRYYILSIGTGLDSLAIEQTGREDKRRFGRLAYVASMIKVLIGVQPHRFTITVDGQKKRVQAADVLATNIGTLVKPLRWGDHIKPDDGIMDVCIIRARNLFDILLVLWDLIRPGAPRGDRNLRFLSAKSEIKIVSDKPLAVQGDGEVIGKTPVQAKVVAGAVRILVPNEKQQQKLPNLQQAIPDLARELDKVRRVIAP